MATQEAMTYVATKVRELGEWVQAHPDDCYEDLYEHVSNKLVEIRKYADDNNVKTYLSATQIVDSNHDSDSSSSDYEESSSSSDEEW